jgi:excinuclease ABC subunit A
VAVALSAARSLTLDLATLNSAQMSKSSAPKLIRLRGVRHHNLKNFDLDLPIGKLIVVTGLSGSGKSSLAFDTLFAEGQRRYIETFSPYARQFFDRMDKPQVDRIEGIPPAIAIEQRNSVKTTRSTVGTMTELTDYLKLLWPHLATLHCRNCGEPVRKESPSDIWRELARGSATPQAPDVLITFDLALSERLSVVESLNLIAKQGYQRLLFNGAPIRIEEALGASALASLKSAVTVIQDRLKLAAENRSRFVEGCEQAFHFGKGKLTIFEISSRGLPANPRFFSNRFHCATCDIDYREPTPAMFSFNHPLGACPTCRGFGRTITIDYNRAIPDRSKTLAGGAVKPWQVGHGLESQRDLTRMCKARHLPMNVPFGELSSEHQRLVIDGDPNYGSDEEHEWPRAWYGVKGYFRWLESKAYKMHVRVMLSRYRAYAMCSDCHGKRFQPEALLYKLNELTLSDFYQLPIRDALDFIAKFEAGRAVLGAPHRGTKPRRGEDTAPYPAPGSSGNLSFNDALPERKDSWNGGARSANEPLPGNDPLRFALQEIRARLHYLNEVGLGYLTLDRPTRSLSGGETERVNLTTCLGTRLVNTLYVLDEPSVGLHPRDTERLVRIVQELRDIGNTVVVVEHEPEVMRAADHIVDLGPGHGESGGEIVYAGDFSGVLREPRSLTGQYLSGNKQIPPVVPRLVKGDTPKVRIANASANNLKNLTVEIPLGRFVCLTGVSGSGKSTLARDVLYPLLQEKFDAVSAAPPLEEEKDDSETESESAPPSATIEGWELLGEVVLVDQSPLGRTPRSNPAVYVGAFEPIRELFAATEAAKQRGLNASAFSFNSGQGQCEKCRGAGFEKIEMQFLSDVFVTCPECGGRRYREHILEVKLEAGRKGKVISESVISNQSEAPHDPKLITDYFSWSIADLLEATIDEVVQFLSALPESRSRSNALNGMKLLQDVGLGYLHAGQPINTLSGGESQRLKLVSYLAESAAMNHEPRTTNHAKLFIFDEPTTGLHFDDVRVLVEVFQRLVNDGHSLLVIEHNLELIRCADWLIDLGPEAGDRGGEVVAQGTPAAVARQRGSLTGLALAKTLPKAERLGRTGFQPVLTN